MGIDASIYGMVGQGVPRIDVAGALGSGMQLGQMRQGIEDDKAMRELSQQTGGNMGQLADLAQGRGLYKQAGAIRKQELDRQKEIATIQETFGKVDEQKRKAAEAGNADAARFAVWADTPEKWQQGMQVVLRDHPIMTQGLQPFLQFSPENRKAVITKAMTVQAAIDGLKPKVEERSGAMVPVTTDVVGGQTVGMPVGFKPQDEVGKINQDLANGLISPEQAQARREMATTRGPAVQVINTEKPPAGYRWAADGSLDVIKGGPADKLSESQQKIVVGSKNLQDAIAGYRAALKDFGMLDTLSPNARARMGTVYNNMMLQAKEAYNLGVLSGPDLKILESVVTDPRSFTGAVTSKEALDSQAQQLLEITNRMGKVASDVKPRVEPPPAKAAKAPMGGKVWTVKNDSDYNALPPGAHYKGPDGVERVK